MKKILILCLLSSCAAVPIRNSAPTLNIESNFTSAKTMDKAWDGVLQYVFGKKSLVKSQFKGESSSSIRVSMDNAPISYIDKKTNAVHDTSAVAFSAIRERISNRSYVYPVAGNIECVITINKQSDGLLYISVSMDKYCTLTQFLENYYLEKRKKIPNVEINSTGEIERGLKSIIEQQ